jgi:hypothetical protein
LTRYRRLAVGLAGLLIFCAVANNVRQFDYARFLAQKEAWRP